MFVPAEALLCTNEIPQRLISHKLFLAENQQGYIFRGLTCRFSAERSLLEGGLLVGVTGAVTLWDGIKIKYFI